MTDALGPGAMTFRDVPRHEDLEAIRHLVAATGVFYPVECAIAVELVDERLARGAQCGYEFVLADIRGRLAGYAAWGHVPLTQASYDLYWIVVHPQLQGSGVGRALLQRTEAAVAARGGGRIYIETSSRDAYLRTREFYVRAHYVEVARLEHFYAEGDAKVVYCKPVAPAAAA